jgi:Zn-dependent membrane protease YugP
MWLLLLASTAAARLSLGMLLSSVVVLPVLTLPCGYATTVRAYFLLRRPISS